MEANLPKPEKPYRFDTISKPVSPTDYAMWESTLWDYLKSIKPYRKLLKKNLTWTLDDENNRGFANDDEGPENQRMMAEDKAAAIDSILLKIGTYGPKSIFIDITKRSTSFKYIFDAVKRVCGFPVPGTQLIHYMCIKNGLDKNGTETFNDFYWRLRDEKIASLMTVDSAVTFKGRRLEDDEVISPSMENQIVADWLEAIGGIKLVKYVGQEYAKELEKISLYDLQETLGQRETLRSIMEKMEGEEVAKLNRAQTDYRPQGRSYRGRSSSDRGKTANRGRRDNDRYEKRTCYICKELNNGKHESHNTRDCYLRDKNKKKAKSFKVETSKKEDTSLSGDDSDSDDEEDLATRLRNLADQQ